MKLVKALDKIIKTLMFRRKKHEIRLSYEEKISILIKENKTLPVSQVENLKWVVGSNFYPEKLNEILELAQKENFEEIKQKFNSIPKTFEDLSFFSFSDNNGTKYVAIVYDSDELWQDPQIFKILQI